MILVDDSPRYSRWLILLTTLLALYQASAALWVLALPPTVTARLSWPPLAALSLAVVWALIFTVLTYNLLRSRPRTGVYLALALVGFLAYHAARLLLFAEADYDRQRLPFVLVGTSALIVLPLAYWLRRTLQGDDE